MLGKLEKINLREIWKTEAADFTPWLAKEENLRTLSEALDLKLEYEAQEKSVGPFRADILCKIVGLDEHWVLIENQLERTDHIHLGQLLTYASGLEAVTIIWIAARFTEEHRSTLDWLNKITNEDFKFFGLEVELWRIGDSLAAPKFNIVSKPNNWSKAVASAANSISAENLSELKKNQLHYWEALHKNLNELNGPISGNRKPQPYSWMSYSVGRTGFSANASTSTLDNSIRVEIYITGQHANAYFHLLKEHRTTIEEEFGDELDWQELPEGMDTRIVLYYPKKTLKDESDWPNQHAWLAENLNKLHSVFSHRIKSLDANDWFVSED